MLNAVVKNLLLLLMCFSATNFVFAEGIDGGESLNSKFVAGAFHDISYELLNSKKISGKEVELAVVFLIAASELDQKSEIINETILNASEYLSGDKYNKWIYRSFEEYCQGDADLVVAGKAISHFIEGSGTGLDRRMILSDLLSKVSDRNVMLRLDISNRLGTENVKNVGELLDGLAAAYRTKDPSRAISVKFALPTKTSFDLKPDANLLITNRMAEPLMIFNEGLFKGGIRVDAEVRGDIRVNIPELVSKRIQPGKPINVDGLLSVPLRVITGSLRRILDNCPQASLEINFIVYLDPVVDHEGKLVSSLKGVGPISRKFRRPGIKIDNRYLIRSLSELSKGRFEEKIRSLRLFTGLAGEHEIQAGLSRKYRYFSVEPSFLTSVIVNNIGNDDWMLRTAAMYGLLDFRPPVDYEIGQAVSGSLDDPNWPVRMMATYILSRNRDKGFLPVLEWKAKNDPDMNVRRLAEVLLKTR